MYKEVKKELEKYSSNERRESNERFFKTGRGEYGESDIFIGVSVPDLRKISQKYFLEFSLTLSGDLKKLISSKIHEERLLAVFILVLKFKKIKDLKEKKEILEFYLNNLNFINNWDIVDSSAYWILGEAINLNIEDEKILDRMTESEKMWFRRISIISTFAFIKDGNIDITLRLSKKLLNDKEDLMHKAVGWMLRESWKKDNEKVERFLIKNYSQTPRTSLRYSIERMEKEKRKRFLRGEF